MNRLSKEEYNNEPVLYCSECLSLRIRGVDNIDYCDECGSTQVEETHIKDWEEAYKNKYGVKYLNTK